MRKFMRYTILSIVLLIAVFLLFTGFFAAAEKPPISNKLSKSGLLSDLRFLDSAVRTGHPVNYKAQLVTLRPLIDSVRNSDMDSLTKGEYRFIIGKALSMIGCIHTSLESNPMLSSDQHAYFPLRVNLIAGHLYYTGTSSTIVKRGAEITEINGMPVSKLLGQLRNYAASDGGTDAFSSQYLHAMAGQLIALYFTYPKQYKLRLSDGKMLSLTSVNDPETDKVKADDQVSVRSLNASTTLLKIPTFSSNEDFADIFKTINSLHVQNLVIDLRGNTGGDRDAAVALFSHLVNNSFSYQILQPKQLHPYAFLNGKGKTYYVLSFIKYNIGNFFKGKRTPLGRSFSYAFKSSKELYKGHLFVLTDGFTASSATMVTSWLKQHTNAVFVGRQSGGGYNGNDGGSFPLITLPCSKMVLRFPVYRLILDPGSEKRDGIIPDHLVEYNLEDVLSGKDKDLEKASTLIEATSVH